MRVATTAACTLLPPCARPVAKSIAQKIIVDGTGEMRVFRNTAYLEGSMCGCSHVAFGGCPRGEFAYWREIWLRRVEAETTPTKRPEIA